MANFQQGTIFTHAMGITEQVMEEFARISGDYNSLHTDAEFARGKGYAGRVVYGNVLGMMISTLVGMKLGTEDVMILAESMDFKKPVYIGDTIELAAEVANVSEAVSIVEFSLSFTNQAGVKVAKGKLQIKVF